MSESNQHSPFIGLHLRARNVKRWPLMGQFDTEMLGNHIFETVVVGHVLGAIAADVFGEDINPDRVASFSAFHESSEVSGMGDIPSPVKYATPEAAKMFKDLEYQFEQTLLNTLPDALKDRYQPLLQQDKNDPHALLAKAADVICAWLKCDFELKKNNDEFSDAFKQMNLQLADYRTRLPAVDYFCNTFLQDASGTLDEQAKSLDWVKTANAMNIADEK